MSSLSNQQKGVLYAITSGLSYGLLGYFGISLMNSGLSVFSMLFWRFATATLFMLIILLPKYKEIFSSYKEKLILIMCGMIFYTGSSIFYFMSSEHIGTGLAITIFFTYPAVVITFNILFRKAVLRKAYLIAFFIILIGMVCLTDSDKANFNTLGISLGMLGALLYAGYILTSNQICTSPAVSTLMISLGSMIACLIASYAHGNLDIPSNFNNWFNAAGIGILCTALPVLLFSRALRYISSELISILLVFEPVTIIIVGVLLLGEKMLAIQIIGAVIVLSGAMITLLPIKLKKRPRLARCDDS